MSTTYRSGDEIEFRFRNREMAFETRHTIFQGIVVLQPPIDAVNPHYPDDRSFLRCFDLERGEQRDFPVSRVDLQSLRHVETVKNETRGEG